MMTKNNVETRRNQPLQKLLTLGVCCTVILPMQISTAFAKEPEDLTEMPLEQLLNVEIISASKYLQRQSDVPATSTVINASQIKGFGYRTLSEVLRSVPGLYVSTDRAYDNLGVRGLSGASEFNGRMVVLVDGYRLNEAVYDSGPIGSEFPVDADLIERVEVIRGPASSMYGSNALYGTINVVTKSGSHLQGGEFAASYGSFDTYKGRFSYGGRLDNGLEYLLSATGFESAGTDNLYYPDFASAETNNGYTDVNHEGGQQAFAKLSYGDLTIVGGWGRRNHEVPGAMLGTNFNGFSFRYLDAYAFVQAQYQTDITEHLNFTARTWYGDYIFDGRYLYGDVQSIDTAHADWSGFELRLLSTHFDKQHITAGIEVQKNWSQQQDNYDENPRADYLHDRRESLRIGVYLQDDIALTEQLNLSIGGRFDDYSLVEQPMFSPKAGLTWQPLEGTTLKLLYGSSFRAPNVSHQFYSFAPYFDEQGNVIAKGLKTATGLKPESAKTLQGTWEQKFGRDWLTRATLYHIWLKNLFSTASFDDTYDQNINGNPQSAWGGEFEIEKHWHNGALVRASYSLQQAQTRDGQHLFDSPRQLFKVNMLSPLFHPDLQGGLEILGMGPRDSSEAKVAGFVVANATLNWQLHSKVNFSASVYNLFDKEIFEPRSDGVKVPADGINFRLKLQVNF